MAWLIASGHAADLVIAVMAAELVWLRRSRGWSAGEAALALLPGTTLMIALRLALTDAAWPWIALALAASFPAHLADVRRRDARVRPPGQFADR